MLRSPGTPGSHGLTRLLRLLASPIGGSALRVRRPYHHADRQHLLGKHHLSSLTSLITNGGFFPCCQCLREGLRAPAGKGVQPEFPRGVGPHGVGVGVGAQGVGQEAVMVVGGHGKNYSGFLQ